jgi:hypothetical protein
VIEQWLRSVVKNIKKPEPPKKSKFKLPNMVSITPYFSTSVEDDYADEHIIPVDENGVEYLVVNSGDAGNNASNYLIYDEIEYLGTKYAIGFCMDYFKEKFNIINPESPDVVYGVFQIVNGVQQLDFFYYYIENNLVSEEIYLAFLKLIKSGEH